MSILKELRKSMNLSAKDVYGDICDRRTYNRIENDISNCRIDILLKICGKIGISYQELFFLYDIKNYDDSDYDDFKKKINKSINSNNKIDMYPIIEKLNYYKFKNARYLSLYVGINTINIKTNNNYLTFSPKLINEIISYYRKKKNIYLSSSDYQSLANLLPSINIEVAEKIMSLLLPYNEKTPPFEETYLSILLIYGNYIDKCLELNEIDKAYVALKQYKDMPRYYSSNFEYIIWLTILENLIIYKKTYNLNNLLASTELFKLIKYTKNQVLINTIEKQLINISETEKFDKELIILDNKI